MIAVDTSVLIAITLGEPERDRFLNAIAHADSALVSAASVIEARIVLNRRGDEGMVAAFADVLRFPNLTVVPVDVEHADIADAAFRRFGKGTGHPAQLNFGDLFAYALAKSRGIPLLFKGEDFARTDIASVL